MIFHTVLFIDFRKKIVLVLEIPSLPIFENKSLFLTCTVQVEDKLLFSNIHMYCTQVSPNRHLFEPIKYGKLCIVLAANFSVLADKKMNDDLYNSYLRSIVPRS